MQVCCPELRTIFVIVQHLTYLSFHTGCAFPVVIIPFTVIYLTDGNCIFSSMQQPHHVFPKPGLPVSAGGRASLWWRQRASVPLPLHFILVFFVIQEINKISWPFHVSCVGHVLYGHGHVHFLLGSLDSCIPILDAAIVMPYIFFPDAPCPWQRRQARVSLLPLFCDLP